MSRRSIEKLPRFLKETGKRFVNSYLNHHEPGNKNDIVILSSPRSGSTWLMELFYVEPGVKYIYEPLGKKILDYNGFLPINTRWYWINLSDKEKEVLAEYFLGDKEISHFGPRNPLDKFYNFFTDRRVIKIIRANSLIKWFAREFDYEVIYLVRHPLAQVISAIQRGHTPAGRQFLDNSWFVENYLGPDLREYGMRILDNGSKREKFVLEWCLDNIIPLEEMKNTDEFLTVTYEELVLETEKFIDWFSSAYDLEAKDEMMEKVTSPSKTSDSSNSETREKIQSGDNMYLVKKWQSEYSKEEIKELFEIVEKFGISAYRADRLLPEKKFLHFRDSLE